MRASSPTPSCALAIGVVCIALTLGVSISFAVATPKNRPIYSPPILTSDKPQGHCLKLLIYSIPPCPPDATSGRPSAMEDHQLSFALPAELGHPGHPGQKRMRNCCDKFNNFFIFSVFFFGMVRGVFMRF